MAYYVGSLSHSPRYSPGFQRLKSDGTKFYFGVGRRGLLGLDGGFPLTNETEPAIGSVYRSAVLVTSHRALPDIFRVASEICVNRSVREAIEGLEPDIHQFFEVDLKRKNGETFEGSYYLLNICQTLDSIILDKSDLARRQKSINELKYDVIVETGPRRVLNYKIIKGKTIWRENLYTKGEFYISEKLYELLLELRFKGIEKHQYFYAEEI